MIDELELYNLIAKHLDIRELVDAVYNRAIDDFKEKALKMLKEEQDTRYGYLDCMDIREIAEQLKAGGENGKS